VSTLTTVAAPRFSGRLARPAALEGTSSRVLATFGRRALLVACFLSWEGLTTQFVMMDPFVGRMAVAALCLLLPLPLLLLRGGRFLGTAAERWAPAIVFAYCALVSFVSNTYIFEFGTDNWLPALYYVVPILLCYVLAKLDYSTTDIVEAVIYTGFIAAVLVSVDQVMNLPELEMFYRRPVFDVSLRRIVILKPETVLALLFLVARLAGGNRLGRNLAIYAVPIAIMSYSLFVVSESRLSITTTLIAIALFAFRGRLPVRRRVAAAILALAVTVPLLRTADKYVSAFNGTSFGDYISEYNVGIRLESLSFFWDHIQETHRIGFGIMSVSPAADNFQSNAIPLSVNIVDLGWLGALLQFGVIGLGLVIAMSVHLIRKLIAVGRIEAYPQRREVMMAGMFVLASILNPVPLNLFTFTNTVLLGSTLWYLCLRAQSEAQPLCGSDPVRSRFRASLARPRS
jgi:hypothetical protein